MATKSYSCLLLDEHISPKVATALRKRGVDAYAIAEPEYSEVQGLPDSAVLERATKENRVVITYNYADFTALHSEWVLKDKSHSGIALVARGLIPSHDQGAQIKAFQRFADEPVSRKDQLLWIN